MPLPPPTPTGGLSSGPFTRTEHTYEWQISDSFLRELASHDGVASTPGSGRWESATATEEETLNLPEIWEENAAMLLTDDEAELVMSGQAFLKRSMPERLGRTFVDAVKQRLV